MKISILLMACAITITAHYANAQWTTGFTIRNTNPGNVQITRDLEMLGNNNGTSTLGAIRLGVNSGEAIASKRTAGGNQFGIDFYTAFVNRMSITNGGNVQISRDLEMLGNNNGTSTLGAIRWGGEVIASKRTVGGNQFGLDFYTGFVNRMSITNGGDLVLLGNNNGTSTLGALRLGVNSGEAIASKRTAGGNQFGIDFYTAFVNRMSITNGGNVQIANDLEMLGNNNGTSTLGAIRWGGEVIASKRTVGGNQFGLDFYTGFVNRMSITNGGNVGIGTTTPFRKLEVNGDTRLTSTSGERYLEFVRTGTAASQTDWRFAHLGGSLLIDVSNNDFASFLCTPIQFGTCSDNFKFIVNGNALASGGTWQNSDLKLKRDINDFRNAMDIIKQLKPKTYFFKSGDYLPLNLPEAKQFGFIAQDLEKVLPSLVQSSNQIVSINAKGERKMEEIKSVNYTALIPVLTEAIKEQQQQIDKQQQQIDELKQIISTLKNGQPSLVNIDGASSTTNVLATNAILEQAVPTPTKSIASIRYSIPVSSKKAQLILTDNLGKTIKQVTLSPGKGVVNIDASTLSDGTYNYTLLIDGKSIASKKMIVGH